MAAPPDSGAVYDEARRLAAEGTTAVVATVVEGDLVGSKALITSGEITMGSLGSEALDESALRAVSTSAGTPASGLLEVDEGTRIFLDVFEPSRQLIIFGAVHIAQALDTFARRLGYRVVVVDARRALATRERFPDADQLLVAWPADAYEQLTVTPNTAIAILSHDPKFDEPALLGALETGARYIGAVGSSKTNADRRQRLLDAGVSEEQIARVRGPIGLDLGGSTPEEMAVSILAEMIAVTHGRDGRPLTEIKGAIRGE
ncbi:MAG TPA: XdhC/CoxI family protein [Thermomicrobiales bacterium]|nr:XdhC/CoxI family protein [Thermomicrobiales bacterium]